MHRALLVLVVSCTSLVLWCILLRRIVCGVCLYGSIPPRVHGVWGYMAARLLLGNECLAHMQLMPRSAACGGGGADQACVASLRICS